MFSCWFWWPVGLEENLSVVVSGVPFAVPAGTGPRSDYLTTDHWAVPLIVKRSWEVQIIGPFLKTQTMALTFFEAFWALV